MTDKYIEGIAGLLVGLLAGIVLTLLINNATWRSPTTPDIISMVNEPTPTS